MTQPKVYRTSKLENKISKNPPNFENDFKCRLSDHRLKAKLFTGSLVYIDCHYGIRAQCSGTFTEICDQKKKFFTEKGGGRVQHPIGPNKLRFQ